MGAACCPPSETTGGMFFICIEKLSEMHNTSPRDKPLLNETITGDSVLSGKGTASPIINRDKKIGLDDFKIEKVN